MRRKVWVVVLAVVAATGGGYWLLNTDGRLSNTLELGYGTTAVCTPAKRWPARRAFGQAILKNTGKRDATITDVSLIEPRNVELIGAIAAEHSDDIYLTNGMHVMQIGTDRDWPPLRASRMRGWDERVPAEGYVVRPSREVIFVYGVRATGPAITKGLRVEYTSRFGWSHTARVYPTVTIVPDCDHARKYLRPSRLADTGRD